MEKSLFSSALSPTLSPPLTFMSSHYWSIIFLAWKISAYYFRIAFLQWCVPWEQADLVQTGKNENVSVLLLRKEARHWRLNITNAYWSENYALLGYCPTVLCLCSRETNLQQLLPLPVCIRHASCKEKRSRNSKLVAVLCFTNNAWWGGEHQVELFCVPGISCKMSDFQCLCCSRSGGSSFPLLFLLPRTARSHSPVRFFAAATLGNAAPEAELSDIHHLSHPLFNAISDAETCIYIYI